jgi:hypothetical protein
MNSFNKTRNKPYNVLFISRSYSSQRVQIWQLEVNSAATSLHLLINWSVITRCYTRRQQVLCSWYRGCGKVSDLHSALLLWWKLIWFMELLYWLKNMSLSDLYYRVNSGYLASKHLESSFSWQKFQGKFTMFIKLFKTNLQCTYIHPPYGSSPSHH